MKNEETALQLKSLLGVIAGADPDTVQTIDIVETAKIAYSIAEKLYCNIINEEVK